jgi:hypothetical protein
MSFLSGIPILGDIITGVVDYQKGKQAIKRAKVEGEIKVIQSASDSVASWESYMAKATSGSWKDEYWTVIWSIPLVMGFIKIDGVFDGPQIAAEGFASFTLMPQWYQYTLVTMVLASFGIRMGTTVKGLLFK